MVSQLFLAAIHLLVFAVVSGTVIRKYQYYPPPVCPMNAVCSEVIQVPGEDDVEPSFLNYITCACPRGMYCPTKPGPQTISADVNRWYGLCQPVEDMKRCQRGEVAEEIQVASTELQGKTVTKILCTCPKHEHDGIASAATVWAGTTMDNPKAKTIYHLMCSEDYMTKRGRFGGQGRGRKFYFY